MTDPFNNVCIWSTGSTQRVAQFKALGSVPVSFSGLGDTVAMFSDDGDIAYREIGASGECALRPFHSNVQIVGKVGPATYIGRNNRSGVLHVDSLIDGSQWPISLSNGPERYYLRICIGSSYAVAYVPGLMGGVWAFRLSKSGYVSLGKIDSSVFASVSMSQSGETCVGVSPGGDIVDVWALHDNSVRKTAIIHLQLPGSEPINVVAVVPNGTCFAAADRNGLIRTYSLPGGLSLASVDTKRATVDSGSGVAWPGWSPEDTTHDVDPIDGISYSEDSKSIVAWNEQGYFFLWNIGSPGAKILQYNSRIM